MDRKLFVSFIGTLRALLEGEVSPEQVHDGLFFFRENRDKVFEPTKHFCLLSEEFNDLCKLYGKSEVREVHDIVKLAVELAENDGRIAWQSTMGSQNWDEFFILLATNGHDVQESSIRDDLYCHNGDMRHVIRESMIPVALVA